MKTLTTRLTEHSSPSTSRPGPAWRRAEGRAPPRTPEGGAALRRGWEAVAFRAATATERGAVGDAGGRPPVAVRGRAGLPGGGEAPPER